MEKKLLIVASERYGDYVKEIAESMGCFEAISFVDNDREGAIGKLEDVETFYPEYRYAIACGDGSLDVKKIKSSARKRRISGLFRKLGIEA